MGGSRRAFFPKQRVAPILHAAGGLLLIGLLPRMVHMCADRLFVQPQVQNVRLVSLSSVMLPSFEEGEVPNRLLLLLGNDSASVVVMPAFEQTARVILECVGPLQGFSRMHELKHSLMKYDYRRATFPFPRTSQELAGSSCKA